MKATCTAEEVFYKNKFIYKNQVIEVSEKDLETLNKNWFTVEEEVKPVKKENTLEKELKTTVEKTKK